MQGYLASRKGLLERRLNGSACDSSPHDSGHKRITMVQKEDILFSGSTTRRIGRLQSAVPLLASAYVPDVAGVIIWLDTLPQSSSSIVLVIVGGAGFRNNFKGSRVGGMTCKSLAVKI